MGVDVRRHWILSGLLMWVAVMGSLAAAPTASAETLVVTGALTADDPDQTSRIFRDDPGSTCAAPTTVAPGPAGALNYDAHTFKNFSQSTQCITVTLDPQTCTTNLIHAVAYIPTFNPADPTANYAGDIGASPTTPKSFSFNVPGGASFVVVVHEITPGSGCPGYKLTVESPGPLSTRSLTVASSGGGTGTVASSPAGIDCGADCSESYSSGTIVSLTATPAANSTFAGWSGDCSGTGATCTVTMDALRSVTARFELIPTHVLAVAKAGAGSGGVVSSPAGIDCGSDCSEAYQAGSVIALTATAAAGSRFAGWSGACSGSGVICQVTVDAAKSATATFDLVPVADTRAPVVTVTPPRRARIRTLRSGAFAVRVSADEPGAARAELRLDARTAKRLRTRRVIATAASTSVPASLKLRPRSARLRRKLRRVKRLTVTIRTTVTDAAGNVGRKSVVVTLKA